MTSEMALNWQVNVMYNIKTAKGFPGLSSHLYIVALLQLSRQQFQQIVAFNFPFSEKKKSLKK